jgi:hypothetical protein
VATSCASTACVPLSSRATSCLVLSCSETTPKVSTPSHARPPATPKRRVKNVATGSVLSALRVRRFLGGPPASSPSSPDTGAGAGAASSGASSPALQRSRRRCAGAGRPLVRAGKRVHSRARADKACALGARAGSDARGQSAAPFMT